MYDCTIHTSELRFFERALPTNELGRVYAPQEFKTSVEEMDFLIIRYFRECVWAELIISRLLISLIVPNIQMLCLKLSNAPAYSASFY